MCGNILIIECLNVTVPDDSVVAGGDRLSAVRDRDVSPADETPAAGTTEDLPRPPSAGYQSPPLRPWLRRLPRLR